MSLKPSSRSGRAVRMSAIVFAVLLAPAMAHALAITCPPDVTLEWVQALDTSPTATGSPAGDAACTAQAPIASATESITPGACAGSFTITRTWSLTDECETVSCDQTITVDDTIPPALTPPANVVLECGQGLDTSPTATGEATATDTCDPSPVVTFADEFVQGACPGHVTVLRLWTATDSCGNVNQTVQTIDVDDTTPPSLTPPADVTLECVQGIDTSPTGTGLATTMDACDLSPALTWVDVTTPGACDGDFTVVRTWTATDSCGNASDGGQTIDVDDTTPPQLTCPADQDLACGDPTFPDETGIPTPVDACDPSPLLMNSDQQSGTCPLSQTIDRTWRATDSCGNFSECAQEIVNLPVCVEPRAPLPLGVCQLPDGQPHGANGVPVAPSDSNLGVAVAEQFTPQSNFAITLVRWWGAYFDTGTSGDCSPSSSDDFAVTYYLDDGGVPGAVHAGPFVIDPADLEKCHTDEFVAGLREWQFQAPIPPVEFDAGTAYWLEIVNTTSPADCLWLWNTAAPGDGGGALDAGGYAPTDFDQALCYNTVRNTCRSAGYWSAHSSDGRGINVTGEVLAATGCLDICGELLSNTSYDNADSVLEAMCVRTQGVPEIEVARQLTALSLNCVASGYGPECEGWVDVQDLFHECNHTCEHPDDVWALTLGECFEMTRCFNEGGDPFSVPGTCVTGFCSDNGAPCNADDLSACTSPLDATCDPNPESCHNSEICLDGLGVCVPPNTPSDTRTCKKATSSACTILEVGTTTEADCTKGGTIEEDEACCLLDGCAFGPVTEDLTPCATVKDQWQFSVYAGQLVEIGVDTVNPGTASDLYFSVICDTGDFVQGDDEQPCTFPPPAFQCPLAGFVASGDGLCVVTVDSFSSCTSAATSDYELSVTVDGAAAPLLLTADDV